MLFTPVIDVKHKVYCGPYAVARLTGVPISRIEKMIRRGRVGGWKTATGRKLPVRMTYVREQLKVLKRLGCKVRQIAQHEKTVGRFLADTGHLAVPYLLELPGHVTVAFKGTSTDAFERPSRRVCRAWSVIAPALPRYTVDDALVAKREPKPKPDIKLVRAQKLAQAIKTWERKEKLAKTKLKKLRSKLKRYEKLGLTKPQEA